jgi:hypothetical protein
MVDRQLAFSPCCHIGMACAAVSTIVWTHAKSAKASQSSAALPHCCTNRLSCTCLSSSARSSASAAAMRCSAAASAARASACAWSTWAKLLDQQGLAHVGKTSLPSLRLNSVSLCLMLPRPHGKCSRVNHCLTYPHSAEQSQSSAALLHKEHKLHLLVEIRALKRQRRGHALLGCCLRLSARLGAGSMHLGRTAH